MYGVNPPPTITLALRGGLSAPKNGRPLIAELSVEAARAHHFDQDSVILAPSGYEAASRNVVGVPGSIRGIGRYNVECGDTTGFRSGRFSRMLSPTGELKCPSSTRQPTWPGRSYRSAS